jgi:hypothetical protein
MSFHQIDTHTSVSGSESPQRCGFPVFPRHRWFRLRRCIAVAGAALLPMMLTACAPLLVLGALSAFQQATQTYPGERRPNTEVAILQAKGNNPAFLALDDTWEGKEIFGLDVLPGNHRVKMRGCIEERKTFLCGTVTKEIDVQAGETYDIWVELVRDSSLLVVYSNNQISGAHWEMQLSKRERQAPIS